MFHSYRASDLPADDALPEFDLLWLEPGRQSGRHSYFFVYFIYMGSASYMVHINSRRVNDLSLQRQGRAFNIYRGDNHGLIIHRATSALK